MRSGAQTRAGTDGEISFAQCEAISRTDKTRIYSNIDQAPDCVPVKNMSHTAAILRSAKKTLRLAPTGIRRAIKVASPK